MEVLFTEQAYESLEEVKTFLVDKQELTEAKATAIIINLVESAEELKGFPNRGQSEEYLEHLGLNHKRIVVKHCKIVYRVTASVVYITDFFDTRQAPRTLQKRTRSRRK